MSSDKIAMITGKPELDRLRSLIKGVPPLREHRTTPFASKMWIAPDGAVIPQTDFHYEYFRDPELSKKWDVPYTNEQETRLAALRVGFIRVNYERNTGTLTIESGQRGWTRTAKDIIFMLIDENASSIDNMRISVLDENGRVIRTGYSQVFQLDDREKMNHIPLISESEQGKHLISIFLGS